MHHARFLSASWRERKASRPHRVARDDRCYRAVPRRFQYASRKTCSAGSQRTRRAVEELFRISERPQQSLCILRFVTILVGLIDPEVGGIQSIKPPRARNRLRYTSLLDFIAEEE